MSLFAAVCLAIASFLAGVISTAVLLMFIGRRINDREKKEEKDSLENCGMCMESDYPMDKCPHEFETRDAFGGKITVCLLCGDTTFDRVNIDKANDRDIKIVNRILAELNSATRLR